MKRNSFTTLLAVLVLGLSFTQAHAWDTRIQNQTEAGFNLTDAAAQRILAQYPFTSEDRTDYYADIYDGSAFLLIPHVDKYKFRMKVTDKAVIQANTKEYMERMTCTEGWSFNVKDKAVGELKLKGKDRDYIAKSIVHQLDAIQGTHPDQAVKSIQDLHAFLTTLNVPLLDQLLAVPNQNQPWYFLASHLTKKIKYKVVLPSPTGDIEVSITDATDYVGSTKIQRKFEIEFQTEDAANKQGFGDFICAFMRKQGITPEELTPDRQKVQLISLNLLKALNPLLGF